MTGPTPRDWSRVRGALRALGGDAAGGVGMAIGSAVLGAQPAAAADGDNLVLGQGNSASAETDLTNSGSGSGLSVVLGGTSGLGPGPAALVGDLSTQAGIVGASSAGDGVRGDTTADGSTGVSGMDTSPTGWNGAPGTPSPGPASAAPPSATIREWGQRVGREKKAPVAAPGSTEFRPRGIGVLGPSTGGGRRPVPGRTSGGWFHGCASGYDVSNRWRHRRLGDVHRRHRGLRFVQRR